MLKQSHKSSLPSTSKSDRRRPAFNRQQLLKHLALLNTLPDPLPPALPPSPPASRSASPASLPAPQLKRKSEPALDHDRQKRPRIDPHVRSEPTEDGEVSEDPIPPPPHSTVSHSIPEPVPEPTTTYAPIRRPKRGQPSLQTFDALHNKYHNAGRKLKYSGDARFWSTYPPSHKEYRPLVNPPPSNSSYHVNGGLIARLELVEALVMFAYAIWCKDYSRRACIAETWSTIDAFLRWCKQKWQPEEGGSDAEKAFYGLICMIDAFIHSRVVAYGSRLLNLEMDKMIEATRSNISTAIEHSASSASSASLGVKPQSTPPMLPSPASIGPTNSANSTPTNRDGTPISSASRSASASAAQNAASLPFTAGPAVPPRFLPSPYVHGTPPPPHITAAANTVTAPVTPQLLNSIKDQTQATSSAVSNMLHAQQFLTLPVLSRHFPRTFARLSHSSLTPTEEHEPDFEDDDGELFWPGQSISGEGLGWLCLMGEAMIREFGKPYGYKGLNGVVPKPEQPEVTQFTGRGQARPMMRESTPRDGQR